MAAIAVFSMSGRTARLMSKARPTVPISTYTPDPAVFHRLAMYWGVFPHLVANVDTLDEMIKMVDETMMRETRIQQGQQVVLICGYPVWNRGPTNMALLHVVGET